MEGWVTHLSLPKGQPMVGFLCMLASYASRAFQVDTVDKVPTERGWWQWGLGEGKHRLDIQ